MGSAARVCIAALEQLEIVAKMPGAAPTYGDLRFSPCWDSLCGDKRFDKIVAAAKAASRSFDSPLDVERSAFDVFSSE